MIRIPHDAPLSVQEAFREINAVLERLTKHDLQMHGRRVIGAGDAVVDDDLVTLRQLRAEVDTGTGSIPATQTALSPPDEKWERIGLAGIDKEWLRPRVTDNRVLIGASNINTIVGAGRLAISGSDDIGGADYPKLITMEWYSDDAVGCEVLAFKGRGTRDAATATQNNDFLFRLHGGGFASAGTLGAGGAKIEFAAGENWSSTAQGTGIVFNVTKKGTTAFYNSVTFEPNGSVLLQNGGALATTATDGFTYLPTAAGKPTGTPTAFTGQVPIVYDTTNNRLGFYNSGWKFVGPTPPSCRAFHSVDQSLMTATLTALALDSERFDTDTMHSTVTNNSRITFTSAGRYLIGGCARYAANATGDRALFVRINGTDYIVSSRVDAAGTASATTDLNVSTYYTVAANDYAELIGYQASGAGLNVLAVANYSPEFWAMKVSE